MTNATSAPESASASKTRARRPWVWGVVIAAVFAAVAVGGWVLSAYLGSSLNTIGKVDFDRELAIPPLAESTVQDGVRIFELTLQEGESDLGQESLTPTWGINGPHLGPTLRAERGEHVQVQVTNALDEMSTIHWHGMHVPAEMDGGPHQEIQPGQTWSPDWLIDQPAATLWYHPHPHGETGRHVYQGLAGMIIVDDQDEAALDLPRTYGVDDLPVVVQDRKFHEDGSLDFTHGFAESAGVVGDTIMVNGTVGPYFEVNHALVRLRLLNGSNTRTFNFAFDDGRKFSMIGSDGGLLAAPVDMTSIQLSPGERAEILVAFSPGEEVRLQSGPTDVGDIISGGTDELDIMQFRAADELEGPSEIPQHLVDVPRIEEASASTTRDFTLTGMIINGKAMDMDRVDEVIAMGDTEIWTVSNSDTQVHNFHVHDVQFQILDLNGEEPPAHLRGWKDTVWIPPGDEARLIMTFRDYASDQWAYMYHCHLLLHEDQGMMGQFLVVEPGKSTDPEDYVVSGGAAHQH